MSTSSSSPERSLTPWGYALVGIGQSIFALDDALNGNVGQGLLWNIASGIGMLAAAWSLRRDPMALGKGPFAIALTIVSLVRLADLAGSIGDPVDAQLIAFLLIVVGAALNAWAAWRASPALLQAGALLGGVGAAGYVLLALGGARETLLWTFAALLDATGWGVIIVRVRRELEAAG